MNKKALSGLSQEDIRQEITQELNWQKFRADIVHSWIYAKNSQDINTWTNLSTTQREELTKLYNLSPLNLVNHQISKKDPTQKFLFEFADGKMAESVLMTFKDRESRSACISSQIGCAVGCTFCATGKLGFSRNLHYSEIVDQVMSIQRVTGERVANLVYMGQGEPLNNFDNVIESIKIFRESVGIGARNITVSTSGVAPKIIELGKTKVQLHLAVSLHAPTQELRESLIPIAKKWPLHELMNSIKEFYRLTKRRVTFEYVLLEGINDNKEDAIALNNLLRDIPYPCLINLIPYNATDSGYSTPSNNRVHAFKNILEKNRHKVTVRVTMGDDIDAACGQLHNKQLSINNQTREK